MIMRIARYLQVGDRLQDEDACKEPRAFRLFGWNGYLLNFKSFFGATILFGPR